MVYGYGEREIRVLSVGIGSFGLARVDDTNPALPIIRNIP